MGCTNWNISVCVWPLPRLGNLRFILEDNSNINLIFDFFLFFRIFWFLGFFIFSFFSFFWFFCFFWFFFEFFDYFNPMGLCIPEGPTPYKLAAPIEMFQSVYDRCPSNELEDIPGKSCKRCKRRLRTFCRKLRYFEDILSQI